MKEALEKEMEVVKDILNVFQLDAKCKEVGLGKEFDIQALQSALKCMQAEKERENNNAKMYTLGFKAGKEEIVKELPGKTELHNIFANYLIREPYRTPVVEALHQRMNSKK